MIKSLPSRERELKRAKGRGYILLRWSLPSRERELKRHITQISAITPQVAPLAGA